MVYNGSIAYSALREAVNEAVYGKQVEKLLEATQVNISYKNVCTSNSATLLLM